MTIKDLPKETPRAWEDFSEYYKNLLEGYDLKEPFPLFLELPFEMQFGVYVSYFKDNGIDVDAPVWDIESLTITIFETFRLQENMMGHFS